MEHMLSIYQLLSVMILTFCLAGLAWLYMEKKRQKAAGSAASTLSQWEPNYTSLNNEINIKMCDYTSSK